MIFTSVYFNHRQGDMTKVEKQRKQRSKKSRSKAPRDGKYSPYIIAAEHRNQDAIQRQHDLHRKYASMGSVVVYMARMVQSKTRMPVSVQTTTKVLGITPTCLHIAEPITPVPKADTTTFNPDNFFV